MALGRVARHLHAHMRSEILHRIDETEAGILHDEADRAAVRAATKAMVELLRCADREGRRFFGMEGAAGAVIGPGFLERHVTLDNVDDVDASQQLLNEALGDHGSRPAFSASAPSAAQMTKPAASRRADCTVLSPPRCRLASITDSGAGNRCR